MQTVIYPPTIDYHWMYQRPQQLMRQFARHNWQVSYCNLTQKPGQGPEEIEANLWLVHDFEQLKKERPPTTVVWTSWAKYHHLKSFFGETAFIYDCVDRFPEWQDFERHILPKANLVFTSSAKLYQLHAPNHPAVHLVRNACDYEAFAEERHPPPPDLCPERRPIIGYMGALAPWLDLDLLEQVARHFPQGQVVLIGAPFGARPQGLPANVRLLGLKPYQELPAYLQHLDVALIPFRLNTITEATNPVKMYEYLAAGKPVIATNLPEAVGVPGVYTARHQQEFIALIEHALAEKDPTLWEARRATARANSWERRFRVIEDQLLQFLAERGGF